MTKPIVEEMIKIFDRGLRTLTGVESEHPMPESPLHTPLSEQDRRHSVGMMRVNHTGEICAQALYDGQMLTAKTTHLKEMLLRASEEEQKHLSWCRKRLQELGASPSILDSGFYVGSYAIGVFVGLLGDRASLGFVAATEEQVIAHLDKHLVNLQSDQRSAAIILQMRADEQQHGTEAIRSGGTQYPQGIKRLMTFVSKVMTKTSFWI